MTPIMLARHEATMQMGDEQLAARCRAGDLDAFGTVYARYERQVFRYAYHLLGDREDADDVKQETFLKAYQAMGAFRSEASLQTWLFKICGNLCRDRIKSWENRKVVYDSSAHQDRAADASHALDPAVIVDVSETKALVLKAMHNLPPAHREVLVLHEIEELSYEDIAGILGCSAASVKLKVFRARRLLKERVTSLLKAR